MNCKETQSLIMSYINEQLDIEQLEKFIQHIETCNECKEELEVYYTLLTSMKQLDEDKNLSGNFHNEFIKSLHKSEERIRRAKLNYVRKRVIYVMMCIAFGIMVNTNTFANQKLRRQEAIMEIVKQQYDTMNASLKDTRQSIFGNQLNMEIRVSGIFSREQEKMKEYLEE